ncbi:MAG: lipid-A-disaccharide synthase [bacterium]|nr:lipid-A-disaccharide synthase [bacterium]
MQSDKKYQVLIVAGEASGDGHASNLIKEVKALNPNIHFKGMGGKRMKDAGAEIIYDIDELGVIGLFEVLKKVPMLKRIQKHFLQIVTDEKPDLVVLVDYPGFNLRLAEKLKPLNVPVLYYILPQVWAWGRGRIKKMAELTDKMASIIPFEPELFKSAGGDCEFIGHPLIDKLDKFIPDKNFISSKKEKDKINIIILPGSRKNEINSIFPKMVKTAEVLSRNYKNKSLKFFISIAETIPPEIVKKYLSNAEFDYEIFHDHIYDYLSFADFGIVTSGTATLETGLFSVPMVILYKTSWLTYFLAKFLVKVDNIGLINIIAGKRLAMEFIQRLNPTEISDSIIKQLNSQEELDRIRNELKIVREKLGDPGASGNGANLLIKMLK